MTYIFLRGCAVEVPSPYDRLLAVQLTKVFLEGFIPILLVFDILESK